VKRLLLSLVATVAVAVLATSAAADDGGASAVYTISNAASANELVVYSRSASGALTPAGSVSAGGRGTGGGLASPPPAVT
jgi:hypothetical protein